MDIVICRGPWTFADIIMLVLQRWTPNHGIIIEEIGRCGNHHKNSRRGLGTDSTFVREEKLDGIADDSNMHSMELFDEIQNVKWFGALSVLTLVMLMSYHQSLEDESTREPFVNANPGVCVETQGCFGRNLLMINQHGLKMLTTCPWSRILPWRNHSAAMSFSGGSGLKPELIASWIINSSLEITVGIKEDTVIRLSLNPLRRNKNQKLLMVSAAR
uniref:Glycosyltransferases n=1 Tax=Brassica oleracea TaxID=3712 RepID=A0A3P6EUW3_BRAOL|nr:unnamed protein product [Brassica oleracea]